ncbi:MAG: methyltransferase [Capsulimonadales bacterium]|nr:methyltransferase [Capsulimonadales bacterium]
MLVLSRFQAVPLIEAILAGETGAETTPDLFRTTVPVVLANDGVTFPDGTRVAWTTLTDIADSDTGCFKIAPDGTAEPIRAFSEQTRRYYSLHPTPAAPTMLVSGIPMHRIKNTDPQSDTLEKIKAASPVSGTVLDTATGLGYTAIVAAKTAMRVITVELDPAASAVAERNPWSRELFDNPRIERRFADSYTEIETFAPETFAVIVHDPPTMSLGGDLYSGEFYRRAFRVLKRNGRMFHYIGDPDSRTGASTTRGVVRRLQEAGFKKVTPFPAAFGVTAYK